MSLKATYVHTSKYISKPLWYRKDGFLSIKGERERAHAREGERERTRERGRARERQTQRETERER